MPPSTTPRHRRAAALATACAAAAALALPAVAQARIVPGRSVAGVRLGDSAAQIRHVLGTPDTGSNVLNLRYIRHRGIGIYLIAGKAFEIAVVKRGQRTASGIGLGSTQAAVTKAYPKARCAPAPAGGVECHLAARFRKKPSETVFAIGKGVVTRIAVHFTTE